MPAPRRPRSAASAPAWMTRCGPGTLAPSAFDYLYLICDGVRVRVKGATGVCKRLALCMYGITPQGQRELIDYRIAKSESEKEWVALLEDLRQRGLKGEAVTVVVTDGGQGLINAPCSMSSPACACSGAGRIGAGTLQTICTGRIRMSAFLG